MNFIPKIYLANLSANYKNVEYFYQSGFFIRSSLKKQIGYGIGVVENACENTLE